jgi:hypothetical protein
MNKTTSQIRVSELIPILSAIADRNWERFKEVENQFVAIHGVEAWEDFFALRLKPALDKESDRWLLQMWCSLGIISVKNVA